MSIWNVEGTGLGSIVRVTVEVHHVDELVGDQGD